ncbi:MAG: protein phosphatase 2C domain-containing protein [Fimbriimonadaceae bacterium]|nr:protein phosphatase 2C domain-containing protein [Fimbriimonadaceae bacterium]
MEARWVEGDTLLASAGSRHPDQVWLHQAHGPWQILGASAVGQAHRRDDTPRDDALCAGGAGPWLVAAVADGAGSAALSRFGATTAVRTAVEVLLDSLPMPPGDENQVAGLPDCLTVARQRNVRYDADQPTEVLRATFQQVHRQVGRAAEAMQAPASKLHCTLLVAALQVESGQLLVGQVGDGAIVYHDPANGGGRLLLQPPSSSQAGETYFITQPDWPARFDAQAIEAVAAGGILLLTDGIADDVTCPPPDDVLTRFSGQMTAQLLRPLPPAERAAALLRWVDGYRASGSFDDRTMLALLRAAPPVPFPALVDGAQADPGAESAPQPTCDQPADDQQRDGVD